MRLNKYTSESSGASKWLSVTLVTVVSVNVDLVIVSVTRPRAVGEGGRGTSSTGAPRCTVIVTPPGGTTVELLVVRVPCAAPPRKCAGIIA